MIFYHKWCVGRHTTCYYILIVCAYMRAQAHDVYTPKEE